MAVSKQFAFPWLPSVFSFPLSPAADPGKCRCKQIIALKHLHILVLLHLPALAGLPPVLPLINTAELFVSNLQ